MNLTRTDMANGYANRHLFVLVKRSKLLPDGGNLSDKEIARLSDLIAKAIEHAKSRGRVERSDEARTLWHKIYSALSQADKTSFEQALDQLERRCPDYIEPARWQQCIADASRFLASWDDKALALGWTAQELFGLHESPAKPHPSYGRLSRYDCTGLLWLLQGRHVIALTATTAAILGDTGNVTTYRKLRKPALGPLGDSDDFQF